MGNEVGIKDNFGGRVKFVHNQLLVTWPQLAIAHGHIPTQRAVHKYGRNSDLTNGGGFEAIWNGGGDYTGHNPTVAETLEVFSGSAQDVGTVLSSGTATEGTPTTLVDLAATFVSDGVAVGDIVLNDTQADNGMITAVTQVTITVLQMDDATTFISGDAYRVVTKGGTGTR